jgi:hypothetical protein
VHFATRHGRYVIWRRVEAWGWHTRQTGESWPGYANANEVAVFPPAPAALVPLDTDGDGLPDFREDANGDGLTGAMETDFTSWDCDEDGCSDAEEVRQGTDPRNPDSLVPKRLGWWRFNQPGWEGEQGQLPRQVVGLQRLPSWSGTALGIPYSGTANLKYHDTEPGGMNINCRRGTVRFWFRPNWSTGSGPWTWARLIELGAYTPDGSYGFWAIYLNPEGNLLQFLTQGGGTGAAAAATVNWTAGVWYQITVTYGPTASIIYVNGEPVATGSGVTRYPAATVRQATGLNVGSNSNGDQRVNGQIEELETFNFELSAATIQAEYEAMRAPSNDLDIRLPGLRVNTPLIPATVTGPPAAQMAVRLYLTDVETPDFSNLWGPFLPGFGVDLGTGDGPRYLWVGFRGVDSQGNPGLELWRKLRVVLDTTPPVITLIEPAGATTSQPVIQVQGTANEGLNHVSYDLVNGNGTWLHEAGLVLPEVVDEATFDPIAWPFQLFDVELAPGVNSLTLRATDLAGNTATLPLNYTLDLSGDTTPPGITLRWPLDGAEIASDTLDLRGQVDDACASVTVSGLTPEPVVGLVERNGQFWVEGLPLRPGANVLTLTATDAAGNVRSQTLTVNRSSVTLTIHEPSEAELARARLTVTGTISEAGYAVWVNGVRASLTPDGTVWAWRAEAVPLGEGGTAVLQARAIPLSHHNGAGDGGGPAGSTAQGNPADSTARDTELQRDRPARLYVGSYFEHLTHILPRGYADWRIETTEMHVRWGSEDGIRRLTTQDPQYGVTQTVQTWPAYDDQGIGIGCVPPAGNCPECEPESYRYFWALPTEYCNVADVQFQWNYFRPDNYVRFARTTMLLDTGGKARPLRRNLFALWAAAYAPQDPRLKPPYTDATQRQHTMTRIEPSDQIRVLGWPLGRDGYLYVSLPDGVTVEVTPKAPGRFYYFEVSATKHRLVLTADGQDLESTVPEFCVGERVDFKARLEPPVDAAVLQPSSGVAQWVLPGKFVNEAWQGERWVGVWPGVYLAPYGSVNYRVNPALLRRWDTSCWYVNKPGGPVRFGAGLQFKNGQYAIVTGRGKIEIYRPSATLMHLKAGGARIVYGFPYNSVNLDFPEFQLNARISTRYLGVANWAQLVRCDRVSDILSTGYRQNTHGEYWLDNTYPYSQDDLIDNTNTDTLMRDSPQFAFIATLVLEDYFKTYLIFKPANGLPSENIYVTLKKIEWQWNAAVVDPWGSGNVQFSWDAPMPVEQDSDEFPEWRETLLNWRTYP